MAIHICLSSTLDSWSWKHTKMSFYSVQNSTGHRPENTTYGTNTIPE